MSDPYLFWKNALKKIKQDNDPNSPQCGFYRKKNKDSPPTPVAYYLVGDVVMCRVGDRDLETFDKGVDLWTWVCASPVTEEAYRLVAEEGKPWPDMDPVVSAQTNREQIGGNNPPPDDETDGLKDQIDSASAGVDKYATVDSDEKSQAAQSLRSRLLELSRAADKAREAKKRPHIDAGKEIDKLWQPLVAAAKAAADKIAAAMGKWEDKKRADAFAAQKAATEAAAKAASAAAEAGKPAPVAPTPAPTPPSSGPIKGAYGRAASPQLKTMVATVDLDKVYAHFKNRQDVLEFFTALAQKSIDQGFEVPGVTTEQKTKIR